MEAEEASSGSSLVEVAPRAWSLCRSTEVGSNAATHEEDVGIHMILEMDLVVLMPAVGEWRIVNVMICGG